MMHLRAFYLVESATFGAVSLGLLQPAVSPPLDVALLVGVITTAAVSVLTAVLAYLSRNADRKFAIQEAELAILRDTALNSKVDGVHVLVNDNLTQEKLSRLLGLKTSFSILKEVVGTRKTKRNDALFASLQGQIDALTEEIEKRDATAATLTEAQKVEPELRK